MTATRKQTQIKRSTAATSYIWYCSMLYHVCITTLLILSTSTVNQSFTITSLTPYIITFVALYYAVAAIHVTSSVHANT
jgi:uncharacterized membrane protein